MSDIDYERVADLFATPLAEHRTMINPPAALQMHGQPQGTLAEHLTAGQMLYDVLLAVLMKCEGGVDIPADLLREPGGFAILLDKSKISENKITLKLQDATAMLESFLETGEL